MNSNTLMNAYEIAAQIVTTYGDKYLPLFQRLHEELERQQGQQHLKNIAATVAERIIKPQAQSQ